MRIETGPVQFGDDWRGIFIRGDDCFEYVYVLKAALEKFDSKMDPFASRESLTRIYLQGLIDLLESSNEHAHKDVTVQRLKSFEECVEENNDDDVVVGEV